MMKSRFPMEPGEPVAVPFGWSDRSDMPNSVFYEDVNFELCCVMFNIAAAHATIAMNETRSDMDSIKNAFMHFQCAAWPLQQLRDELGAAKFGSADFEPDFLTFFIKIMLVGVWILKFYIRISKNYSILGSISRMPYRKKHNRP